MIKKSKLLLGISVCIIGSSINVYADNQNSFLKDLEQGLSLRWEDETDENTLSQEEFMNNREKLVNYEYDLLEKYKNEEFDNDKFEYMAHAYIEALECQKEALNYYTELPSIYDILWSTGYNMRATLLPDFVDYYGLVADETEINGFRESRDAMYTTTVTTTIDNSSTNSSASSIDTSNVNVGNEEIEQEPIEIYNNDGIKLTISSYEITQFGGAKLTIDAVNLNHKDLVFYTSNYTINVNGYSVNAYPYGKVPSGKTGYITLELYPEIMNGLAVEDITSIDFNLGIYTDTGNITNFKDETGDIFLNVNNSIVTKRTVYKDAETVQKVQQLLSSLGYNVGSTDGVPGKLTNSAILQFKNEHGLDGSTDITPELLDALEQATKQ